MTLAAGMVFEDHKRAWKPQPSSAHMVLQPTVLVLAYLLTVSACVCLQSVLRHCKRASPIGIFPFQAGLPLLLLYRCMPIRFGLAHSCGRTWHSKFISGFLLHAGHVTTPVSFGYELILTLLHSVSSFLNRSYVSSEPLDPNFLHTIVSLWLYESITTVMTMARPQ